MSEQTSGESSASQNPLQSTGLENAWLRERGGGGSNVRANIGDIAI